MLSENETRSSYDTQTNLSHISGNLFEDASINSLLNHGGNYTTNIGQVLKVLEDWRNRFNITVVKECDGTEYCAGEFRDLIIAYNSIHGYVSLLVSRLNIFLISQDKKRSYSDVQNIDVFKSIATTVPGT